MVHFNHATVSSLSGQIVHNAPDTTYAGAQSPSAPQVKYWGDETYEWAEAKEDVTYGPSHPCYSYAERVADNRKKKIVVPPSEPYHDPTQYTLPDMDHLNIWSKCHLLSLPKEVRLEIWRYVLTDPSTPELLVGIFRGPSSPYRRHPRPTTPNYNVSFSRNKPVNVSLLQVNRSIYEEALSVLYRDTRFAPWDLEGILPLFLDSLSPLARSSIHHIKLFLPGQVTSPNMRLDPASPFFNWAITCAQVAKLNDSLRSVEVEGDWSIFNTKVNRRAIIAPLLKIRAKKTFTHRPKCVEETHDLSKHFEQLLVEVKTHLEATAEVRKQRTEAEAIERAAKVKQLKAEKEVSIRECEAIKAQKAANETAGRTHVMEEWRRYAEENIKTIEKELSIVPGIEQFERELAEHSSPGQNVAVDIGEENDGGVEEWDLVSVRSGASTPKARPGSVISRTSDDTWTDTASTILGKEDDGKKGEESDAESESWEEL